MRDVLATILTVLITAFMGTVALFSYLFGHRYGALCTRYWARSILWILGIRADVSGREHVGSGPYVVVANHSSMLDIPVLAAHVPVIFHFVSRPFFFKVPFMGWGMTAAGHISIERGNAREAAKTLEGFTKRFEKGMSVCLFPEGTRSPDGTVQRYKRGPFLSAVDNEVPILPVALGGVAARLPKGRKLPHPGRIAVTFGPAMETKGKDQRATKQIARELEAWTRETISGAPLPTEPS
ncbi:MAG: lysophospholipid acyltransferase family protein [Planctomycetota bacterium]